MAYRVRPATLDDLDVLVRHRIAMFTDMGVSVDEPALAAAFARWLKANMPAGAYRAWLVESSDDSTISPVLVAGGGATIIPWPPGPQYPGERLAFVYNVYTEPAHRKRGLGRLVMDAIHEWCRAHGVTSVALNTSVDGRGLYESLGYAATPSPMMFLSLVGV
ncbi:MAG TPA: GNAT family N-acetyltransferase [Vicinamibacterales bacterium]|jgi:GNAT superfamily N-acetyltransferase